MIPVVEKAARLGESHTRSYRFDADPGNDGNEGTAIQSMWERWQSLFTTQGDIPRADKFARFDGRAFYTDVSADHPDNFILNQHPDGPCGQYQGMRLGELPGRLHKEATGIEYSFAKFMRRPSYVDIDQTVLASQNSKHEFIKRKYRRLALPLADENGDVIKIAYTCVFFEPVYLVPRMSSINSWRDFQAIAMSSSFPYGGYIPVESGSDRLNP